MKLRGLHWYLYYEKTDRNEYGKYAAKYYNIGDNKPNKGGRTSTSNPIEL